MKVRDGMAALEKHRAVPPWTLSAVLKQVL